MKYSWHFKCDSLKTVVNCVYAYGCFYCVIQPSPGDYSTQNRTTLTAAPFHSITTTRTQSFVHKCVINIEFRETALPAPVPISFLHSDTFLENYLLKYSKYFLLTYFLTRTVLQIQSGTDRRTYKYYYAFEHHQTGVYLVLRVSVSTSSLNTRKCIIIN
jgi:hypothetical protein